MKNLRKSLVCSSLLAVILATPVVALAEKGVAKPDRGECNPAEMMKRHQEMHARHMEKLHAALKLKPNQESAWKEYADSRKPPEREKMGEKMDMPRHGFEDMQKLTTPQRIEKMKEMDKKRAEMADKFQQFRAKRDEATLKFYNALDGEQQKVFDQQSMPMPPMHPGHMPPKGKMPTNEKDITH